jgi:hypothetical protein
MNRSSQLLPVISQKPHPDGDNGYVAIIGPLPVEYIYYSYFTMNVGKHLLKASRTIANFLQRLPVNVLSVPLSTETTITEFGNWLSEL